MDGEDTCDPFIKVECMNISKQTSVKNDISYGDKTIIEEHLFLEIKGAKKDDIEKAQIKFSIVNKGFFKGDTIGEFEMALTKIYNSKEHTLPH